jgi:hypothetical protein
MKVRLRQLTASYVEAVAESFRLCPDCNAAVPAAGGECHRCGSVVPPRRPLTPASWESFKAFLPRPPSFMPSRLRLGVTLDPGARILSPLMWTMLGAWATRAPGDALHVPAQPLQVVDRVAESLHAPQGGASGVQVRGPGPGE